MELFDSLPQPRRAPALEAAVAQMSRTDETERGAVFTKRVVVDAILDLVGYTVERPLHQMRLMEPSFGDGDFLLPALDRLLVAFAGSGGGPQGANAALREALLGVELHGASVDRTRDAVVARLVDFGLEGHEAAELAGCWLVQDDFLLAELGAPVDVVVGNPPYVRQERIPGLLLREYRRRFKTVYDRADLYVPFYERSLRHLKRGGRLGFICSDRWIKNKYGGPLRGVVAQDFHLRHFIDMVTVEAFTSEVIAYPAITVIERASGDLTRVARRPDLGELRAVARAMENGGPTSHPAVEEVTEIVNGRDPWLLDSAEELALLRGLERRLPTLESACCRVGIGVATGADKIFTGIYAELPVEEVRKLRMAMPADIAGGVVTWGGRGVVNPFEDSGSLASLDEYPLFATYLRAHEERLRRRHVAKKNPSRWYRTIDRIHNDLVAKPKLLIPDIKGGAEVGYDPGGLYPHHNLYYVLADEWELRSLQAVLRSSVALFFVNAYCIKMAGGFLRFQAQYLRRICLPRWGDVPHELRGRLKAVASSPSIEEIDSAVFEAYELTKSERALVASVAKAARGGR